MAAESRDTEPPGAAAHWAAEAERWAAWARTPGHDAYWCYRHAFFALIPPPGRATLEVGCGEGRVARDLSAAGHRVTAVDLTPALLELARQAESGGTYVRADAAALPFRAGAFDLVVAYNSLMDVDDMPAAVLELARVLAPGGRLGVCVTHPRWDAGRFATPAEDAPFVIEDAYLGRRPYAGTFERDGLRISFRGWCHPLEEYSAALERAGLCATPAAARLPADPRGQARQLMKESDMDPSGIKALTFDVFGTVVDWRASLIREGEALGRAKGLAVDWGRFADAWRGMYQPAMDRVRSGAQPWTKLDDLHRASLDTLLGEFKIGGLAEAEIDALNRAWHRLDPWPDAVPGLTRLRPRYVLATLSNGNVALMVNMAKRAGLPWDAILGAEVARAYKPQPECYLTTAALLGLRPEQCLMVAAHNGDLVAASKCGLRTAFVPRPAEHGPGQTRDLRADHSFDFVARDFLDLASQLGC